MTATNNGNWTYNMTGAGIPATTTWPPTTTVTPWTTGIGTTYSPPIPAGTDIYKVREAALGYALDYAARMGYPTPDRVLEIAAKFEEYLLNGKRENGKTTEVSGEENTAGTGSTNIFGD